MRKFLLLLFMMLIWFTGSAFTVVGHRGNPNKYPEETIQSFNSAFSDGAEWVELDLHVSKDNQLVVSHDRDLKRVTGTSAIVSQNNFSYLQTLTQANGEPIHSLNEIFYYYRNQPNAKFLIETKKTKKNNPKNMEQLLVNLIKQYKMEDRVMVHSFSAKSLKTLSELMPDIPLIAIVGSLAKINFDTLSYVDGVNVSSKLVTDKLIDQLHYLKKKVFVWDQMQEDPKQWNWLVNLPIDGVVTNFPATGHSYQIAMSTAKSQKVDQKALVVSKSALQLEENPYLHVQTDKQLHPFNKVHVTKEITVNKEQYYELASGGYVKAESINFDLNYAHFLPYLDKKIASKENVPTELYDNPETPTKITGTLLPQEKTSIIGMNTNDGQTWLKTPGGWIQNKHVLIYGIFTSGKKDFATSLYLKNSPKQRLSNISLDFNNLESYYTNSNNPVLNNKKNTLSSTFMPVTLWRLTK